MLAWPIIAAASIGEPNGSPGPPAGYETRSDAESRAAAHHRRMDANGDGYVTRAEIAAFVVEAMNGLAIPGTDPAHPLPPVSAAIFEAADTDHDGRLSLVEEVAAADRDFAAMDTDDDGLVSPEERMAFLTKQLDAGHLPFGATLPRNRR